MPLPTQIQAVLEEVGDSGLSGTPALDQGCAGAKFHSPSPLILHEVALAPSGEGETAWLCGTCRDNLAVLRHLLVTSDGALPWVVRREFGNLIRALALRGWQADRPEDEVASA
jgi:hypothetical protein